MVWGDDTILKRLLGNAVLSLVVLAMAARALGPAGLGGLVLVQGLVRFVAETVKFQSWQGVVRFGAVHPDELPAILAFSLLLDGAATLTGIIALALSGEALARHLGWATELGQLLPLYGTALLGLVPGTASGVLRLFDRFDLLAVQSAMANLVRVSGTALAWSLGGGLGAFVLVWWVAALAAGLFTFVFAGRELKRRGLPLMPHWPKGLRRRHPDILGFFMLTSVNAIVASAPGHMATLMVGSLLGPAAAGLFRVARQIADAAAKPVEFVAQALYPEAARLDAGGETVRLRRVLLRLALLSGGLAVLAFVLLMSLGEPLVRLVAGKAFLDAVPVMRWLAAAAALVMATGPVEPVLVATGHAGRVVMAKAAAAIVQLGLLWSLAPASGLNAAGWGGLAGSTLLFALLWLNALRPRR